jgi:hypothetical protein
MVERRASIASYNASFHEADHHLAAVVFRPLPKHRSNKLGHGTLAVVCHVILELWYVHYLLLLIEQLPVHPVVLLDPFFTPLAVPYKSSLVATFDHLASRLPLLFARSFGID